MKNKEFNYDVISIMLDHVKILLIYTSGRAIILQALLIKKVFLKSSNIE